MLNLMKLSRALIGIFLCIYTLFGIWLFILSIFEFNEIQNINEGYIWKYMLFMALHNFCTSILIFQNRFTRNIIKKIFSYCFRVDNISMICQINTYFILSFIVPNILVRIPIVVFYYTNNNNFVLELEVGTFYYLCTVAGLYYIIHAVLLHVLGIGHEQKDTIHCEHCEPHEQALKEHKVAILDIMERCDRNAEILTNHSEALIDHDETFAEQYSAIHNPESWMKHQFDA